jgi:hypothetical protein
LSLQKNVHLFPSLFSCSCSLPFTSGSFRHSSSTSLLTLRYIQAGYVNNSMFGNQCHPSHPGKCATGVSFLQGDVEQPGTYSTTFRRNVLLPSSGNVRKYPQNCNILYFRVL